MKEKIDAIPLTVIRWISKLISNSWAINECWKQRAVPKTMSFYFLAPLIVFLIWYALHRFSDDVSAIESFQSAEDIKDDTKKEEIIVKKSEWRKLKLALD